MYAYFLCTSVYTLYIDVVSKRTVIFLLFRPNTPYNTACSLLRCSGGGGDDDDDRDDDDDDDEKDEEELKIYTHVLAKLPYRRRIVYA